MPVVGVSYKLPLALVGKATLCFKKFQVVQSMVFVLIVSEANHSLLSSLIFVSLYVQLKIKVVNTLRILLGTVGSQRACR